MRAPVAATASGIIALTVAAVPTGMNTGVSTGPCAVASRPSRAAPSRASISKPMPEVELVRRGSHLFEPIELTRSPAIARGPFLLVLRPGAFPKRLLAPPSVLLSNHPQLDRICGEDRLKAACQCRAHTKQHDFESRNRHGY